MIDMIRTIVTSVTEGVIKRFSGTGRANETFTDREYFQHYGFTSRPLAGAEAIVLKKGNNIIVVASDDRRYRIALQDGEVAIYTNEGDSIHMKRGREIRVTTEKLIIDAATKCQINSAQVNLSGDLVGLKRLVDERLIDIFNTHTHPGDSGGTTGVPNQTLSTANSCTDKARGA
ncbi:MAG: phage baseplate assembly protein [Thermodesulfobacteriota bacterium]|nr:phage baseplate assembly protein [Thermodesulfobacteriota bacterium]